MNVFLTYVRDPAYFHLLPGTRRATSGGRIRVMAFPPLGIQTLAPVLRRAGHRVRMFDTCHPQMRAEDIAQAARQDRPDAIALSFLSVTAYPAMKALARHVKAANPEIPIVVGGAFASINSERILSDCPEVDHVGVGEGEELLIEYLDHLDAPGAVAGLTWRDRGVVVKNAPRPMIRDLDQFPYPDRTSLPIDYIESLPLDVPAVLSLDRFCTMQTSRGCPYTCVYCDIPSLSQRRWRSRSAAHVLGEMQELSDQGYRSVYLTDDHFLLKRERIGDICNGIIDRGLKLHWGCEGRVDSVGVDSLALMAKARCDMLAYGVEAGTQKTLDRLEKRQTLAQVEHAVAAAKKHGITRVHGFFVIGCPGETAAEIRETFRFAARLELDTFGFNRLAVYRGTPLWNEYVARGIIDEDRDWDKTFKCCDIDPDTVPNDEVNRLRMKGYASLLLRRILVHPLRTWDLLRTLSRHMAWRDLLRLISGPFRTKGASAPALPARMVDAGLRAPPRAARALARSGAGRTGT
ncbi:MAG TPA: radical SAM protein [Anaeromyxobacter sp.]|nr:radical SAM protein [Anaeromyxobacter sp.]